MAFENGTCGFTDNNNPTAITLKNCTSLNNGQLDKNKSNYNLYREKNGTVVTVSASDFVTLSVPESSTTDFQTYFRNTDGTVNLRGYGKIVEDGQYVTVANDASTLGARLSGEAVVVPGSEVTETPKNDPKEEEETEETTEESTEETEESTDESEEESTEETTEESQTEIKADFGIAEVVWESGSYSMNRVIDQKAAKENNVGRIRMTDAVALTDVTEISKAEVTEVKANFSIDQGQDYVWVSGTYAQGNAKEGATYYVTTQNIWGNYKDLNFQKYVELMDAGLKFDIVIVE